MTFWLAFIISICFAIMFPVLIVFGIMGTPGSPENASKSLLIVHNLVFIMSQLCMISAIAFLIWGLYLLFT